MERKEKEVELRRRQRMLDDFPHIVSKLEDATIPMQDYLNIRL